MESALSDWLTHVKNADRCRRVADVAPEDLASAFGGDSGGDDHGHRGHLRDAVADFEIGGVQKDVGELGVVQAARPEDLHGLVELGADARHLGLGDPRVRPQRGHEVVHRAGGDAFDVGLRHHRVQSPVDAAAGSPTSATSAGTWTRMKLSSQR